MKYIFVSGGVVSGLGKGIIASSIGLLLKDRGVKVTNVKVDMYINVDAGTIRPQEHGEVFVTHDGLETDQDLGNYERFVGNRLRKENYLTTGQVYKEVIDKERRFEYEGEDVEAIPHVTDEIIRRWQKAGGVNEAEVVIVELGGTVGEYQNALFFEASRILKTKIKNAVMHVHVTYLPYLDNAGELKSKPAQQSVHMLNAMGIQPDFLVARSKDGLDEKRKEKIVSFCNLEPDRIIDSPDLKNIYRVPLNLNKQKLAQKILKIFGMVGKKGVYLRKWKKFVLAKTNKSLKVAVVGKYFETGNYKLSDSYISVIEAVNHASKKLGVKVDLDWVSSFEIEKNGFDISQYDGLIVPQGWGKRGVEGKIEAIRQARIKKVPYLGLCFGMQMAVVEFARNVVGLRGANSIEVNPETNYPVIHVMDDQIEYLKSKQYGGTIRLGAWPCKVKSATKLSTIYKGKKKIFERHRHRYEFNNKYLKKFRKAGMVFSGLSPDGRLVEAIELKKHPFFVGVQFHPEYISTPLYPHPLFVSLLRACTKE